MTDDRFGQTERPGLARTAGLGPLFRAISYYHCSLGLGYSTQASSVRFQRTSRTYGEANSWTIGGGVSVGWMHRWMDWLGQGWAATTNTVDWFHFTSRDLVRHHGIWPWGSWIHAENDTREPDGKWRRFAVRTTTAQLPIYRPSGPLPYPSAATKCEAWDGEPRTGHFLSGPTTPPPWHPRTVARPASLINFFFLRTASLINWCLAQWQGDQRL
jgi:hypothetical protein